MLGLFSKFFKPNKLEYFGHLGQVSDPQKIFLEQNYIICRNALSLDKIDKLVNFYDSWILATSSLKFLRQSGNWESTEFTDIGGVRNWFLNPHSVEMSKYKNCYIDFQSRQDRSKTDYSLINFLFQVWSTITFTYNNFYEL